MEEIPGQFSSVGVPEVTESQPLSYTVFCLVKVIRYIITCREASTLLWWTGLAGVTHQVTWRWGGARPPRWSRGTAADLQPSHRIYNQHPCRHTHTRIEQQIHWRDVNNNYFLYYIHLVITFLINGFIVWWIRCQNIGNNAHLENKLLLLLFFVLLLWEVIMLLAGTVPILILRM